MILKTYFSNSFNTLKENKQIVLNKLRGSSNEANFLSKEERYKNQLLFLKRFPSESLIPSPFLYASFVLQKPPLSRSENLYYEIQLSCVKAEKVLQTLHTITTTAHKGTPGDPSRLSNILKHLWITIEKKTETLLGGQCLNTNP